MHPAHIKALLKKLVWKNTIHTELHTYMSKTQSEYVMTSTVRLSPDDDTLFAVEADVCSVII